MAQSSSTSEASHHTVQHLVQSPLKSLENATSNLSVYTGSNASNVKLPVSQTTPDNTVTTSSNHGPLTSTSVHAVAPAQTVSSSSSTTSLSSACKCEPAGSAKPTLDTRALAEASRNLTQTLKQLSSEVLTPRPDQSEVSSDNELEQLQGMRSRRFNTAVIAVTKLHASRSRKDSPPPLPRGSKSTVQCCWLCYAASSELFLLALAPLFVL
jgi:hypothetical protein